MSPRLGWWKQSDRKPGGPCDLSIEGLPELVNGGAHGPVGVRDALLGWWERGFVFSGDLQGACWLVAAHIPGDGMQTGTGSDGRLSGSG